MKKLYISCPVNGRKIEDIEKSRKKMKEIAEAVFGEKLEVIDVLINPNPPLVRSVRIWNLGENIKKMASADYYIGVHYTYSCVGCFIENEIAEEYEIKKYLIDNELVCPDIKSPKFGEENEVKK